MSRGGCNAEVRVKKRRGSGGKRGGAKGSAGFPPAVSRIPAEQRVQAAGKADAPAGPGGAAAGGNGAAEPVRRWWPAVALRQWPEVHVILQFGPLPAPATSNSPEPVCEAMRDVMAEIVGTFKASHYACAKRLGLSKEFIRLLATKQGGAGQDTILKLCRAAGCTAAEVQVEAHARCICGGG